MDGILQATWSQCTAFPALSFTNNLKQSRALPLQEAPIIYKVARQEKILR